MAERRPSRRLRAASWATLVLVGLAGLALLLWPWGSQVRDLHIPLWYGLWRMLGSPGWFTPEASEQLANAAVMLPPMAAATVLAHRAPWWRFALAGAAVGVVVELAQWLVLPARVPDPLDALSNAVGALLGVGLGAWLRGRGAPPATDPTGPAGDR